MNHPGTRRDALLLLRAQTAGHVREDLTEDDIIPVVIMLISTVAGTTDGGSWHRYLALVFDAFTTSTPSRLPIGDPQSSRLISESPLLR